MNCLPVPSKDSRIENILEFREKRRSELLRFRYALDELTERILQSPDQVREKSKVIEEIELSLLDIHNLLDETSIQKISSSVQMLLDVKDSPAVNILFSAVAAGATGLITLDPAIAGAVGLSANAALNLTKKKTKKIDGLPDNLRDFAYLYSVESEKKLYK